MSTADSNNRLVKRQPAFCPHTSTDTNSCGQAVLPTTAFQFGPAAFRQWRTDTVFFSFQSFFFSWCSFFILSSSIFSFSVQQCSGEHEDPAAEPDSADGELGTPSDHLPPAHHQLHGLLQLGETWCRRWKYLHQDWGPEHGEYYHQLLIPDQGTMIFLFFSSVFFFLEGCVLKRSDWFAEPQMYLAGSEGAWISDSVYRRWQVVMNFACGFWLI